jgi:acetylornithine/succinyldiaminopimelate/putrescine aminotransferase
MTNREIFLRHLGQTSPSPLCLDITEAKGSKMWGPDGKEYIDLIAGISVCNVGHCHPAVVKAIQEQAEKFLHIMVYGELLQTPQIQYAKMLTDRLPQRLDAVFYTASGTEATEGAMKLAKRVTGRSKIISFKNSYHGSTQGALSVMGSEEWRQAFRPLLPGIVRLDYNDMSQLSAIDEQTACVIAETVQAEAGVNKPTLEWMKQLRDRCTDSGALLILDEIQCGFGRTGTIWCFEQYDIVPDILLLGKALGGGMPLGAFVAAASLMQTLTHAPVLGHINTFGGHPVSCAAGRAAFKVLLEEKIVEGVKSKSDLFCSLLKHPAIKKVSAAGLIIAVHFSDFEFNKKLIDSLIEKGVFTDWFLFASNALRIAPPLNISEQEIRKACEVIINTLSEMTE